MINSSQMRLVAMLAVLATAVASAGDNVEQVRKAIAARDGSIQIANVQQSPVSGLYLTAMEGTSGYITPDGRYFIVGDMYELPSRRNLTEEVRQVTRHDALKALPSDKGIVFAPATAPKYTVTVFTDVDCPYCRKLHNEIAEINSLGIAVRYLAFPRSGPGTESWTKMQAVWCSKDKREALTRAKRGEEVAPVADCHDTQVAEEYALGLKVAVQGTPMIVLEDGTALGGYVPATQLLGELEKHNAKKVAQR